MNTQGSVTGSHERSSVNFSFVKHPQLTSRVTGLIYIFSSGV